MRDRYTSDIFNIDDIDDINITEPVADNNILQYNSSTGQWENRADLTMDGFIDMQDNPIIDVNYIDFNLVNGVARAEGRAVWNDDEGGLQIGMKGSEVTLQIGFEQLLHGKNVSGTGTTNGRPVRISGTSGNKPEFSFSEADVAATAGSIGLFTEDINNNALGYVTTFGLVRDIDASGTPVSETWNDADRLWVSNTSGRLTNIEPTSDERKIFIGIVITNSASVGIIWVSPINVSYLRELSGNQFTTEVANNIIQFDGTVWENRASLTISGEDSLIDLSSITVSSNFTSILKTGTKTTNISGGASVFPEGFHKQTNGIVRLTLLGTVDNSSIFQTGVDSDTFRRHQVEAGGTHTWGPGNIAMDTNLYRSAADILKTDDQFQCASLLTTGTITGGKLVIDNVEIDGDILSNESSNLFTIKGAGLLIQSLTNGIDITSLVNVTINSEFITTAGRIKNDTLIDNTDSPYTALSSDHEIFVDTDTTAVVINLPAGIAGTNYRITNTGSSGNDISVAPNGAELLTGVNASRTLSGGGVLIITYNTTKGWW